MKIAIIGLGLIGGSLALDLKARGFTNHIIGIEHNEKHQQIALKKGIVDEICELEQGVKKANLVILTIPVNAIIKVLPTVLNHISDYTTVVDMGSTKNKSLKR